MILPDEKVIKIDLGLIKEAEIVMVSDIHYGAATFNKAKWDSFKNYIFEKPNRYFIVAGDIIENAIPGSKSDVFSQTATPMDQQEWFRSELSSTNANGDRLADRCLCIIDGNHENNRSTKVAGLYPLYDICKELGIEEKYRHNAAALRISIGSRKNIQTRRIPIMYYGVVTHKSKDQKNFCAADLYDGIDFFVRAHDHDCYIHPRKKIKFDTAHCETVMTHDTYTIDAGSFMNYGGYGLAQGHRPQSLKVASIIIDGVFHNISAKLFDL